MTLFRTGFVGLLLLSVACEFPVEPGSDSEAEGVASTRQEVKGGRVLGLGEKPGVGGITGGTGFCSGTLISKDQILTAAHCLCDDDGCPPRAGVWFRSPTYDGPGDDPVVFIDGDVVVHPAYDHYENYTDIAIINLDRDAPSLAGTPYKVTSHDYNSSTWVQIIGRGPNGGDCRWRDDDYGHNELWTKISKYANGGRTIQFNADPTCGGDSGGPVLRGSEILGVVSGSQWTFSNGWVSKAVSTAYYYDWILEQVCGASVWGRCNDRSPMCECPAGVGDCDSDDDCKGSLVCGENNGPTFGYSSTVDVCIPAYGPETGTCGCTKTGLGDVCSYDPARNNCAAGYTPTCTPLVGACGGCECTEI